VVPLRKRSPCTSPESNEPKRKKTTIAGLEKRIDELIHANTRTQQDLAFLAGAIERLTKRLDKTDVKHMGLKSHVNIIRALLLVGLKIEREREW
jgi:hypothetical protein